MLTDCRDISFRENWLNRQLRITARLCRYLKWVRGCCGNVCRWCIMGLVITAHVARPKVAMHLNCCLSGYWRILNDMSTEHITRSRPCCGNFGVCRCNAVLNLRWPFSFTKRWIAALPSLFGRLPPAYHYYRQPTTSIVRCRKGLVEDVSFYLKFWDKLTAFERNRRFSIYFRP